MRNYYPSHLVRGILLLSVLVSGAFLKTLEAASNPQNGSVIRGERPPIDIMTVPDEAFEQGIIRIKFSRSLENYLDNAVISTNSDGSVRFGIAAIDLLNQQFGVIQVKKTFNDILQNMQFNDRHRQWEFHLWYDLIIPEGTDIRSMVLAYSSQSEIQLSEPVYRKQLVGADINPIQPMVPDGGNPAVNYVPNDPRYNEQWHYNNTGQQSGTPDADIDLPEAWELTKGNSDVIVAVIDQGIEYLHTDLAANMWPTNGYNFVNNNATIIPGNHGTHVAGTIAGNTNNALGVSGIAGGTGSGNGVRLMSCQVFIEGGSSGGFQNAPIWAADHGAAISQNSWGYTSVGVYDQAVLDAIDYFNLHGGGTVMSGGITIFAAGNSNLSGLWYPGCYANCLSVAATGNQDMKAWYSNYDTWVDISAPGGETNTVTERGVLSTLLGGTYGFYQGTSMACPHVSGVAALILSLAPGFLTPADLKNILTSTTDDISAVNPTYAGKLGTGRLNAFHALQTALSYVSPVANFSASPTIVCTGGSVTFTDLTLVSTSWVWSFPGGTPSFFVGQNPPPVTYALPGLYDVSLTVSDGIITNTKTNVGYISVQNLIADFAATPTTIYVGSSITFTDISSCGPATWQWSFPGGSPSTYNGQTPPPIFYPTAGTYNVTLTVTKPGASDTKTKSSYITVAPTGYNMVSGTIMTCSGNFYDSGGSAGNYQNYENFTLTFSPGTTGAMVKATFSSFNTESGYDYLYIYNGVNTSAPLIGTYTGTGSPGTITASNPSGALTFRFTSDYSVSKPGWAASISCYNTPPVADFSASTTTPTVFQTVTLSDLSTNLPTSWTWAFSPNTITFSGGTGINSQNPQVQFNEAGTYTVTLVSTNAGGSDTEIKTNYITVSSSAFCTPAYTYGTVEGDFISLVQLGSINNATGAAASPFYTYYNALSTNLTAGSAYTITLSPGTYSYGGNYIAVWIDYNKNGVFEVSEKLGNVLIAAAPATGTISFTVPTNAPAGVSRMRVREVWNGNLMNPCTTYDYGETEDYNVNIVPVSTCIPTYSLGSGYGDYISKVELGSINNVTGPAPSPYYTNYSAMSTTLTAGSVNSIILSPGTYSFNNNIAVWIDYNYNGVFDAVEKLGNILIGPTPATGTITFTVPVDVLSGTTRMRVREAYNVSNVDPCAFYSLGETEDYTIQLLNPNKVLNLTVLLEGLYNGATMNPVQDVDGSLNQFNKFSGTTVDTMSVYLANVSAPFDFVYGAHALNISPNGNVTVLIPGWMSGSYYISAFHRSSIQTWSSSPVSLDGIGSKSYDFTTSASQAFGSNQKDLLGNGTKWGLFSGDIYSGAAEQDGYIDFFDLNDIFNRNVFSASGFQKSDLTGDGFVDFFDLNIVFNNNVNSVGMNTPQNPAKGSLIPKPDPEIFIRKH